MNVPELIFDEVRKAWVSATPEEVVRQELLKRMIYELGFPKSMLAVEKDIRQLPHLRSVELKLPDRRADIICFSRDIHPQYALFPLLVVECKEEILNQKAIDQLVGYNYHIKAHFIGLANQSEIKMGYYDKETQSYQFIPHLPSYARLLTLVRNASL